MSRVRKFFISMLNRGFLHGGRCLFDGTYFGIELHMQKLYECDFKFIFYCKMSRLVPQKIAKIYVSFETCCLSYKPRLLNSTHYFAYAFTSLMLILKQQFSPNNKSNSIKKTRKNSDDSSTATCDITQKDWTAPCYLIVRQFVMRKIDFRN